MTDLVLLHGSGQLADTWSGVVAFLPAGIIPKIPVVSGGYEEALQSVEHYLDKHELRRVALVGHGMGAMVALRIAATQPSRVSHLVLSAPVLALDQRNLTATRRGLKMVPGFLFRGASKKNLLGQLDQLSAVDLRPLLPQIQAPTLVIRGSKDTVTAESAQEIMGTVPGAREVLIDAGPTPHVEDPARFAGKVGAFIS